MEALHALRLHVTGTGDLEIQLCIQVNIHNTSAKFLVSKMRKYINVKIILRKMTQLI
jgi:hypothetical protein